MTLTRKLASIRCIDAINPIPGADAIEVATVGGWKVVVKRGEYRAGDTAVYCEIDSWIPTALAPFLSKGKEPSEYNGVKGERLRTVKLRGTTSQGLLIPISAVYGKIEPIDIQEGRDITDLLGIQKWEPVIPAQLAGQVRGNFPDGIPKTDQERAQNLVEEIAAARAAGRKFQITEKLEGSSCTMYLSKDGDFHVCSRNLSLKQDENNAFWKAAIKYDVKNKMQGWDLHGYAIQGELVGPGIQGNIYNLSEIDFFVFDMYDVQCGYYVNPRGCESLIREIGLKHVPIIASGEELNTDSIDELLLQADGKSVLADTLREGLVYKDLHEGMSFKCISNQYLTKQSD